MISASLAVLRQGIRRKSKGQQIQTKAVTNRVRIGVTRAAWKARTANPQLQFPMKIYERLQPLKVEDSADAEDDDEQEINDYESKSEESPKVSSEIITDVATAAEYELLLVNGMINCHEEAYQQAGRSQAHMIQLIGFCQKAQR